MKKLLCIVLGLVALQIVAAEETFWKGPKVVFEPGFYGCGVIVAGKNVTESADAPPLTLQFIACKLSDWSDQRIHTVQQGAFRDFERVVLCNKNHYIDDTFAVFADKLKYFSQNTIEVQDFTFHCNDAEEFSTLGHTDEFKKWEIYDYYFVKGYQIDITRSEGYFESYKHVDLSIFYKELSEVEITNYQKILTKTDDSTYSEIQEEILDVKPPREGRECAEGLVHIGGECQKVCGYGQVNDHGECRDTCTTKTDVELEGRCVEKCPDGWAAENRVCVAQCGKGYKKYLVTPEKFATLVEGGSRRQHKSFKKINKKLRRKLRK